MTSRPVLSNREGAVRILLLPSGEEVGGGHCHIRLIPDPRGGLGQAEIEMRAIQWNRGYQPPFPLGDERYSLVFEDGLEISGWFKDIPSRAAVPFQLDDYKLREGD